MDDHGVSEPGLHLVAANAGRGTAYGVVLLVTRRGGDTDQRELLRGEQWLRNGQHQRRDGSRAHGGHVHRGGAWLLHHRGRGRWRQREDGVCDGQPAGGGAGGERGGHGRAVLRQQWLGAGDGHRWNGALYRDWDVQQGGGHLHVHRDRRPWLQRDDDDGDGRPAGDGAAGDRGARGCA